jgi:hypothetical protein
MSRLGLGVAAIGLALATAAVAQSVPGLNPRLPYAATAPDDALSLGGARVLPADDEGGEGAGRHRAAL